MQVYAFQLVTCLKDAFSEFVLLMEFPDPLSFCLHPMVPVSTPNVALAWIPFMLDLGSNCNIFCALLILPGGFEPARWSRWAGFTLFGFLICSQMQRSI